MCTDRYIYWKCLHKHSIETPSTTCEYYLVNLRYPPTTPTNPDTSPAYRDQYLSNQEKCTASHNVTELIFTDHICDTCELQDVVDREERRLKEREESRKEALMRVVWREECIEREVEKVEKRSFEKFLEEKKGWKDGDEERT